MIYRHYGKADDYFANSVRLYEELPSQELKDLHYWDALFGLAAVKLSNKEFDNVWSLLAESCKFWSGMNIEEILFYSPLQNALYKEDAIYFFEEAAEYHFQLYLETNLDTHFIQANLIYQRLDTLLGMRQELSLDADQYIDFESSDRIFSKMIRLYASKYLASNNNEWLNRIFYAMERNKASLLIEGLNLESLGRKFGVPDSILQIEKDLYVKEKELFESGSNPDQKAQSDYIQTSSKLKEYITTHFPEYQEQKFLQPRVTLENIEAFLIEQHAAAIQFHVFNDKWFALATNGKERVFEEITKTQLIDDKIDHYLKLISQPEMEDSKKNKILDTIDVLGHKLYNYLLRPFEKLIDGAHTIYISATDTLQFIPFETLKMSLDESGETQYLGDVYHTHFAISMTTLQKSFENEWDMENMPLSVFAFSGDEQIKNDSFIDLFGSNEEAKFIKKLFDLDEETVFKGKDATKQNFIESATINRGIVHISVHGIVDYNQPLESSLVFRDKNDRMLNGLDVLRLNLDCPLAVLSSCDTGSGRSIVGETFHMARPFIVAGAERAITSQWKLHDDSAFELIKSFYTHLKSNHLPHVALSLAKRDVRQIDQFRHPYFWASLKISA